MCSCSPGRPRLGWADEGVRPYMSYFLVQQAHGFKRYRTHDCQALAAQFVNVVLSAVPEDIVVTIVKINEVGGGYAPLDERHVVVFDVSGAAEKM